MDIFMRVSGRSKGEYSIRKKEIVKSRKSIEVDRFQSIHATTNEKGSSIEFRIAAEKDTSSK